MIGRQTLDTRRAFTLEELEQFLRHHWDTEQYNDFFIGRPTPASIEEYILLPATRRFMVIVYARKGGGLFSKSDKVILSVCETPLGVYNRLSATINTHNIFYDAWLLSKFLSTEKERKGPAEDALQKYTAYLRELLARAGYLK